MDEGHSQGPEGGNKIEDLCNIESSNSSLRSVAALTSPAPLSADGPSAGGNIWPGSFVRSFRSNNIPLSTSHSSFTQDERSSKMGDARYHPTEEYHYVKQPKKQSLLVLLPTPPSSEEIFSYIGAQFHATEADSTAEGCVQSIDSDESGSVSSADYEELTIAYTKHQIILSLMREVYTMFSSQWQSNVRTRRTTEAESSRVLLNSCESTDCSKKNRRGKRANCERDRSQGDGNDGKKKKNNPPDTTNCESDLQLACPFHKYDPIKYCPNIDTGVKYRTCLGLGSPSINRLKQHLRRTHVAPIQFRRCWLVMENTEEMSTHANADLRCEAGPIQLEEGVSQEKMLLINSKWGATWEDVFKILFPDAPVPSPYHDPSPQVFQRAQSFLSPSSDLRDFEAYNRTTLPLLVEASLRAAVSVEVAPIKEQLRTQAAEKESSRRDDGTAGGADTPGPSFFVEPPHPNENMIAPVPVASNYLASQDTNLARTSDSGYGSHSTSCGCSCHFTSGLSSTLYGRYNFRRSRTGG